MLGEDDDGWCVPVLMEGSDEAIVKARQLIDDIVNPTSTILAAKRTFSLCALIISYDCILNIISIYLGALLHY